MSPGLIMSTLLKPAKDLQHDSDVDGGDPSRQQETKREQVGDVEKVGKCTTDAVFLERGDPSLAGHL
jgi:hypothetical protein